MNRTSRWVALAALLSIVMAACGSDDTDTTSVTTTSTSASATTGPTTQARSVTDWTETLVTLDQPATRVACLFGACVDALAELGLVPVLLPDDATSAGLDEYFDDGASGVPVVGGNFFEPDLEDVAAAEPDLIIGGACFHEGLREALTPIAPLLILDIGSYELAIENLRDVAVLTGKEEDAESAIDQLESRIQAYADASPGDVVPLSLYPTGDAPLIDSTDSQVGSLLDAVGEYPWPAFSGEFDCFGGGQITYSMEQVLEVDPDVLFVVRSVNSTDTVADDLANDPIFGELAAVSGGAVHEVRSFPWSVGGTRSSSLALDIVMTTMYPEEFAEPID